jgi:hypothetical protein
MNRVLLIVILVAIVFGCKEDEPQPVITIFKFGSSKELKTFNAYISDCGFNDFYDTQDFKLTFPTQGIKLHTNNDLTGQGDIIIIHLHSTSITEIVPGTYTSSINESDNSFDAGVITGKDFSLEISGTAGRADNGTVEVSKAGEIYTIVVSLTKDGDPLITGTYKGKLIVANCY